MVIQSSILAWEIPWTEESQAGYSPWGHKESDCGTEHVLWKRQTCEDLARGNHVTSKGSHSVSPQAALVPR